jgi:REP element-mobilizing transposase RayT
MPKTTGTTSRHRRRHRRPRQLDLALRRHGGRRRGSGRKPNGARAGVSHRFRGRVTRHTPVHVTLKVADDLPNLRSPSLFAVVREAIYRGADRFGLRVIHFCVLRGHLHLIVEADSVQALARGMQGLTIRLAKQLNNTPAGHKGAGTPAGHQDAAARSSSTATTRTCCGPRARPGPVSTMCSKTPVDMDRRTAPGGSTPARRGTASRAGRGSRRHYPTTTCPSGDLGAGCSGRVGCGSGAPKAGMRPRGAASR